MFLQLYRANMGSPEPNEEYGTAAQPYLEGHPVHLAFLMDQVWRARDTSADYTSPLDGFPFDGLEPQYLSLPSAPTPGPGFLVNHLIYAYMVENTRAYEIFEKVVFEYLHGEKLGFPTSPATARWLRATEELFYKSSSNYLIQSLMSNIRSDIRASRRNAYYRLFGMDLNHGTGKTANYPYHKPTAANKDFVSLFEELLSEIWVGVAYENSIAGPCPIDLEKMRRLIERLHELLTTRKQEGNLSREEFYHVATMSWLHLTLYVDNAPVVRDMAVSAESPAERLRQIGDKVGYPAHPKADAFFEMAEEISQILACIERLGTTLSPQVLYTEGGALRTQAERVITNWSIAAGKDLKSLKVRSGQPAAAVR
ncbi:MAG: hypothetical protein WAW06_11495 [bacterium]